MGSASAAMEKLEELSVREAGESTYSLGYLLKFARSAAGSVSLQFSGRMPLMLQLWQKGGRVGFYLAPRVD